SRVVLPTPLRPTSPTRSGPKLRSRCENSGLPSGVDQARCVRVMEAGTDTTFPMARRMGFAVGGRSHGPEAPARLRLYDRKPDVGPQDVASGRREARPSGTLPEVRLASIGKNRPAAAVKQLFPKRHPLKQMQYKRCRCPKNKLTS